MGRPHRIEIPDAYYHVMTRGNDRKPIYFGNWSGRLFVRELERASRRYGWRILAFCLMTNHHHVVLQIGDGGLSRGMCELNGRYARMSNWITKRSGHLFGGRFRSRLIDSDSYLWESCRYVLLNPTRTERPVADPRDWRWSSMRATLGLQHPPSCLDVAWVLSHFDRDPERARLAFATFIDDGRAERGSTRG